MKIIHICLGGPFTEGLTYQENLLTKYHARMGNKVTVITSEYYWNKDGNLQKEKKLDTTTDENIRIIRLKIKNDKSFSSKFKVYENLYETLLSLDPDILFIHGTNFIDLITLRKYLSNYKKIAYLDNHCDKSNSGRNFVSYYFLHKGIWKILLNRINPFIKKFFGVMPARVDWLTQVYGLPKDKCDLLVMGADDDLINKYSNINTIEKNRKEFDVKSSDFLIVTGGKIDLAKTQTLLLMKAIKRINNKRIKLLIFGSVVDELKEEFNSLCGDNIKYYGWADEEKSYCYFSMADLVAFPGRHSVYWEEVAALGKPMICKYWNGTTHIDIGGNVLFLYQDSVEEIEECLRKIIDCPEDYNKMLEAANSPLKKQFLYSEIAKKSIEDDNA